MSDEIAFGDWTPGMSGAQGKAVSEEPETGPPPDGAVLDFDFIFGTNGKPSAQWNYMSETGDPLMVVARYETKDDDGKPGKLIIPWSWHLKEQRWVPKTLPKPRPLYGLQMLPDWPTLPVLLVEGEKCAVAAKAIVEDRYCVLTWLNGALGVKAADWTPLAGRKVLIWPDADEPGCKAAESIVGKLRGKCPEIKILDVSKDPLLPKGWDAADALAAGWDWDRLKQFASDKMVVAYTKPAPAVRVQAAAQAGDAKAAVQVELNQDDGEAVGVQESNQGKWNELGVAQTKGGVVANAENCLRVLENKPDFKDLIWFDEFHNTTYTRMNLVTWENDDVARPWRDVDTLFLMAYMQRHLGMTKINERLVSQALEIYAHSHVKNEPQEWLNGLTWDGKDRIAAFFPYAFGVELSEYSQCASKNFWIGMVARILRPGCQMDNMIILESDQGAYKSSALRIIAGKFGKECGDNILNKDFNTGLFGKSLVIINEWDKFRKVDMAYLKDQITTPIDNLRDHYGRRHVDQKRTCVFIATTNKSIYLTDETGGRRYWPMRCGKIDKELIVEIREQCFAEAVHRFKAGESWWHMPISETEHEQEMRRDVDEWEAEIKDYLVEREEVEIRHIALDCFKIQIGQLQRKEAYRIGKCLRALKWESYTQATNAGVVRKFRRKKAS